MQCKLDMHAFQVGVFDKNKPQQQQKPINNSSDEEDAKQKKNLKMRNILWQTEMSARRLLFIGFCEARSNASLLQVHDVFWIVSISSFCPFLHFCFSHHALLMVSFESVHIFCEFTFIIIYYLSFNGSSSSSSSVSLQ